MFPTAFRARNPSKLSAYTCCQSLHVKSRGKTESMLSTNWPSFSAALGSWAISSQPESSWIRRVAARYAGAWELPVLGEVVAPAAVLIRPDGYVAWVGEGTDQGLRDALTMWFGPPHST